MPTKIQRDPEQDIYPDSDGQPMSDNTLQFEWIVTLQGNIDALFRNNPNVFVAGDLLWYPVHGEPTIRTAPDVLVAFGRPKGYRGSYRQWREGGIAPQVVFEVLSPGNREDEMARKLEFYDRYGAEEDYLHDPDEIVLSGWRRVEGSLQPIEEMHGWVSPRLGIRFDLSGDILVVYRPDDQPFLTFLELQEQQEQARHEADEERRQREEAQRQADEERRQREEAQRLVEEERRQREEAQHQADEERRQREEARLQAEEAQHRADEEQRQREQAQRQADEERRQREEAQRLAEETRQRAERLAERLRSLGIDPDA